VEVLTIGMRSALDELEQSIYEFEGRRPASAGGP
jgi:hypothetical protein